MAWTNLTFPFASLLSSTKMTQMDDNFDALAAGLAGAPKVLTAALNQVGGSEAVTTATIRAGNVTAVELGTDAVTTIKIQAGAVNQSKLKTTNFDIGTTSTAGINIATGAAKFSFVANWRTGLAVLMQARLREAGAANVSDLAELWLQTDNAASDAHAHGTFVAASPPYDLGDGEILLFVFLMMDNATGLPIGFYASEEPPWANNEIAIIKGGMSVSDLMGNKKARDKFYVDIDNTINMPKEEREILLHPEMTTEKKNAKMVDVPHPFMSNDLTGHTIVLLDPISEFNEKLLAIHLWSEYCVGGMLPSIVIDNTSLNRKNPPGVMSVAARWKLT